MKRIAILSFILLISLAALFAINSPIRSEKQCTSVNDCSCGTKIGSGECFFGNSMFVNETAQCPDFCTGIDGKLKLECIGGECVQTRQ